MSHSSRNGKSISITELRSCEVPSNVASLLSKLIWWWSCRRQSWDTVVPLCLPRQHSWCCMTFSQWGRLPASVGWIPQASPGVLSILDFFLSFVTQLSVLSRCWFFASTGCSAALTTECAVPVFGCLWLMTSREWCFWLRKLASTLAEVLCMSQPDP